MTSRFLTTATGRVLIATSVMALGPLLAGCESTSGNGSGATAEVSSITKFSSAEYGVAASPRVTTSKDVKKGGGRQMVGKPYKVRGKWYTPTEDPDYDKTGLASWYGPNFHGRLTANGEVYDQYHLSAAHTTFPLPSYARVTNKKNGRSVIVRVNDRGPFSHGRIIDVSSKAAEMLAMKRDGVAAVRVEYIGRAPVEGDDMAFLMASYRAPGMPASETGQNGVMLAMNTPQPSQALPGVNATAFAGSTPTQPAMAALASSSVSAAVDSPVTTASAAAAAYLPSDFRLPDVGPVVSDRPQMLTPTPLALATPEGFHDIGLAYRGDRVVQHDNPFDWILTGK